MESKLIELDRDIAIRTGQILDFEYGIARELIDCYKKGAKNAHYINNKKMTLKNFAQTSRIGREYFGVDTLFTGLLMCSMEDYTQNSHLLKENHPELNNFFVFVANNMRSNKPRQKILQLIVNKQYDINYIFNYKHFLIKDVREILKGCLNNYGNMIGHYNSPVLLHFNNLTVPLLAATFYNDKPILREALKQNYNMEYKNQTILDLTEKKQIAKFLNEILDETKDNRKNECKSNPDYFPHTSQYANASKNSLINLYEKKILSKSLLDLFNTEINGDIKSKKETTQYDLFLEQFILYSNYTAQRKDEDVGHTEYRINRIIDETYQLMAQDNSIF